MAIDLDLRKLPEELPLPVAPNWWYWLVFAGFIALLCAGIALYLNLDNSHSGFEFWCLVIVFPLIAGVAVLSLRLHSYERKVAYVQAYNDERRWTIEQLIALARRPFYVLGSVVLSQYGVSGNVGVTFTNQAIPELQFKESEESAKKALLPDYQQKELLPKRIAAAISRLMNGVDFSILTGDVPRIVALQIDAGLTEQEIRAIWQLIPSEQQFGFNKMILLDNNQNIREIDQWLGLANGAYDFSYLLVIAISMAQQPQEGEMEVATAFLLAGDRLVNRLPVPLIALHRPVAGDDDYALITAHQWGDIGSDKIGNLWVTGFSQETRTRIEAYVVDKTDWIDESNKPWLKNIDDNMGYAQSCCGWFGLGLAIEQLKNSQQPQMVASNYAGPALFMVNYVVSEEAK